MIPECGVLSVSKESSPVSAVWGGDHSLQPEESPALCPPMGQEPAARCPLGRTGRSCFQHLPLGIFCTGKIVPDQDGSTIQRVRTPTRRKMPTDFMVLLGARCECP